MSYGINEDGGSPFGTLGIAFFGIIGGMFMLIGECGSCMGIEPAFTPAQVDPSVKTYEQKREDSRQRTKCHSAPSPMQCLRDHGLE